MNSIKAQLLSLRKKSIRRSIFIFIYAFIFALSLAFFIPGYVQQKIQITHEFTERGKSLTRNLALNAQNRLGEQDRNALFALADSLMHESDLLWVVVMDDQGNVLAENGTVDFTALRDQLKLLAYDDTVRSQKIRISDGKRVYNHCMGLMDSGLVNDAMVDKELSFLEGFSVDDQSEAGEGRADSIQHANAYSGVVHVGMSLHRLAVTERKIIFQLIIMGFLALGAGTVFGFYFANFLLNPLQEFISRLKDIASKGGDLTQRLTMDRDDEFGEMAVFFNQFIENISGIIKETVDLVAKINVSLEEISSTSEELSANADSVNATVQGVTNDLELQEHESNITHTTIETILTSLLETTRKSKDAYTVSAGTEKVSRESGQTVASTVKMIDGISDKMNLIEERMDRLNQALGGIGEFVESIRKIASQTNLLSLNAAIEAARAGEAGRGFSVVAEEVRKLAENTSSASERIQDLIEKIQSEVKGTSEATRQGADVVGQGSKMIDEAGNALSTIMQSAEQSAGVSQDISNTLLQQSDSLKDTIGQVEKMKELVKGNFVAAQSVAASVEEQTASFEQITTAIQKLSEDALNIRKLVVEFKID